MQVRKTSRAEQRRRLQHVAELVGLAALLQRKPGQLSGGQQQRVALARALVSQAPVCLMDEPLSNLDAQLRQEMRRELRELQQRLQLPVVYGKATQILNHMGVPFKGINVLDSDEVRQGIKEYTNWPTVPQLYVKGEFIGGSDIMMEMFQSGELKQLLAEKAIA